MRLQPLQAVVGSHVLDTVKDLVAKRNHHAAVLDEGLAKLPEFVRLPRRPEGNIEAYQLYMASFARRDDLVKFLVDREIEAKVHYPVPLHLQQAAASLGYKKGDFPIAEKQADELITLPNHQFLSLEQLEFMVATIREFYEK